MRVAFVCLILIHGCIHLLGFVKGFQLAKVSSIASNISASSGAVWGVCAGAFIVAGVLFWLRNPIWWCFALPFALVSQFLIIQTWKDSKVGTVANLLILLVGVIAFFSFNFRKSYESDIAKYSPPSSSKPELLTEEDIQSLPPLIQRYLTVTGCVGKSKVSTFSVRFSGRIRANNQSEWMPFTTEQYNFVGSATRLFFMDATMKSLPVAGYHSYTPKEAVMDIRLLSMFRVQYQAGIELRRAETVTFFNDMCCLAPATLIDNRIEWLEAKDRTQVARFTAHGVTITASLHFSEDGTLVNFESKDRPSAGADGSMETVPWSTPLSNYRDFGGYSLASFAQAIYLHPDADLVYGEFQVESSAMNPIIDLRS